MRVVVIGGTGHIGTYLTPRLVEAGFETICVARGKRGPYLDHPAWSRVTQVALDRDDPAFNARIAGLDGDAVIDLTCYHPETAERLLEAWRGRVERLLHCGTIWVHGMSVEVPTTEDAPRNPVSDYGIRKAAIEKLLLGQSDLAATVIHPGHLVGEGWMPLNPAANFNPQVFRDLADGRPVALPNFGRETLHHVHADDVAQCFVQALLHWPNAVGESFHAVSPAALTMTGYAEAVAGWYGRRAEVKYLPWDQWREGVTEKDARITWDHIARSPNCSIAKARERLGYAPRYRSLEAVRESLFSPHFPGLGWTVGR